MTDTAKRIEFLKRPSGDVPFQTWFNKLKDSKGRSIIVARLDRLEQDNTGDSKSLGDGVYELRIDFGPGYRVYFAQSGTTVYLLLLGGDKSTQAKDIKNAKKFWAEFKKEKE